MAASQPFYKHFTTLSVSKQRGAFTASSSAGFELIADWSSDLGESSNVWVCAQMAPTLGLETNVSVSLQESYRVIQVILSACIYDFLICLCSDWLSFGGVFNLPGKASKVKISFGDSETWTVTAEFQPSPGPCSWTGFPCSQFMSGQRPLQPKPTFSSLLLLFFWGGYEVNTTISSMWITLTKQRVSASIKPSWRRRNTAG